MSAEEADAQAAEAPQRTSAVAGGSRLAYSGLPVGPNSQLRGREPNDRPAAVNETGLCSRDRDFAPSIRVASPSAMPPTSMPAIVVPSASVVDEPAKATPTSATSRMNAATTPTIHPSGAAAGDAPPAHS